jgi:hypothetical protein
MNGAILRDVLLVAAASRTLRSGDAAGVLPAAATIAHKRSIPFLDEQGSELAADPHAWFDLLRRDGVRRVGLAVGPAEPIAGIEMPERQLSAFANSGPVWRIEARAANGASLWRIDGVIFDDPPTDKMAGAVGVRIKTGSPFAPAPTPLGVAIAGLSAALGPMIALAAHAGMSDPFGALFEQARTLLHGPAASWPRAGYYLDFERYAGFDAAQMRTLAAITHAWVFGGMGSWNDVGPDGPEVDTLFAALCDACAALANSTVGCGAG